jgi:hypothetical protein
MLVLFHPPPAEAYNGVLLSYPLVNPVTIDGKWTNPQEWSDASQTPQRIGYFAGNGSRVAVDVRILLKHDDRNLYALVDFLSDPSVSPGLSNPDSAWFYLDTLGNGGDKEQKDDLAAWINWRSATKAAVELLDYQDKGVSLPEGMQGASSADASNDPFSSSPHMIYEISIPRSLFNGPSDPAMLVHVQDHTPVDPKTWKPTIMSDFPFGSSRMPSSYARIQFLSAARFWQYTAVGSLNTVQVDGKWTSPDEWADAAGEALVCVQGDGQAYMKVKLDGKMLYILGDFVSDNTTDYYPPSGDASGAYLHIDTQGDDGQSPRTDDYMFDIRWKTDKPEFTVSQGTGSGWSEYKTADPNLFLAASQFDGGNDPYSKQPHAVYEFAISRRLIGNSTTVGIRLSLWDRGSSTNLHWPPMRIFPSEAGLVRIVSPGLTASAQSNRVEVPPGKSISLPITLTANNNFQGAVDLQVSISGQGLAGSLSPQSVTMPVNATEHVDLTIQADQNASPGIYELTISATGEGVTSSLGLTVEVKSAPATPTTVQQTSLQSTAPAPTFTEQIPGGITGLALIGVAFVAIVGLVMLARKRKRSQESK